MPTFLRKALQAVLSILLLPSGRFTQGGKQTEDWDNSTMSQAPTMYVLAAAAAAAAAAVVVVVVVVVVVGVGVVLAVVIIIVVVVVVIFVVGV